MGGEYARLSVEFFNFDNFEIDTVTMDDDEYAIFGKGSHTVF